MKHFVTFNIVTQLFGVAVVFLLLGAELVYNLLAAHAPHVTLCDWIIVLALLLLPLMWFGSPMDIRSVTFDPVTLTVDL